MAPCLGLQEVGSALDVVNMFEGSLSFADNLTMIVNQVNARTHTHAYKALYNVCMYVRMSLEKYGPACYCSLISIVFSSVQINETFRNAINNITSTAENQTQGVCACMHACVRACVRACVCVSCLCVPLMRSAYNPSFSGG